MEARKIIGFGKSSFVVSLPSKWVSKYNLKKGDVVYVSEDFGELRLAPGNVDKTKDQKEVKINVDGKNSAALKREIISAYINNYNVIYIEGKELKEKAKDVRDILHGLVALEIMEETGNKIVAKDFLDMHDIKFDNLIRKIDVTLRSMFLDLKEHYDEDANELFDQRDDDINRLVFLVFRTVKYVMKDASLMRSLNVGPDELLNIWLMTFNMEKIADEVKRISRFLGKVKLSKEKMKTLIGIIAKMEEAYLSTMKSFYNKDRELAYKVAGRKKGIMIDIDKFFKANKSNNAVISITEKMRSNVSLIHAITRLCYE